MNKHEHLKQVILFFVGDMARACPEERLGSPETDTITGDIVAVMQEGKHIYPAFNYLGRIRRYFIYPCDWNEKQEYYSSPRYSGWIDLESRLGEYTSGPKLTRKLLAQLQKEGKLCVESRRGGKYWHLPKLREKWRKRQDERRAWERVKRKLERKNIEIEIDRYDPSGYLAVRVSRGSIDLASLIERTIT